MKKNIDIKAKVIVLLVTYFLSIILIYINYKSRKIINLKGGFITENYNLINILNIIIMKIGIFGYTLPVSINRIIYNYIIKKVAKKYNIRFKNDDECKNTIIQFMIDYKFNNQQKYELKNKQLNIINYPNLSSFILRDIDMKERNNSFDNNYFYCPVDSRTTFERIKSDDKFTTKMTSRIIHSDYKKFHSPIKGKIINIIDQKSELNYPICDLFNYESNSRKIITIKYNNNIIEMTLIGGYLCDNIIFNKKINDNIKIGEELGHFNSEACIITKLNIELEKNIEYNKEYYIQVKDKIGKLI